MSILVSNDALYCSVFVDPTVWAPTFMVSNRPNNINKFFIHKFDLKKGYKILKNYTSCFPVCEYDAPIQQAFKRYKNSVFPINNKLIIEQSQKLEKFYYDTGTFYFFNIKNFLKKKSFLSPNNITFVLPKERVQDINTITDFNLAKIKYGLKKG